MATAGPAHDSDDELLPHTADVVVSAWAPTAERRLTEAVRGLVACFADVRHARPDRDLAFTCDPGPETELLLELLRK